MTRYCRIITLALLSIFLPAMPALADCRADAANITITINSTDPTYDRSLGITKLSTLHKGAGKTRADLRKYNHTLGLTEAAIVGRSSLRTRTTRQSGTYCASVDTLEISIGWATRVRIASELVPGSCLWDAVTEHEQKHVNVDRQLRPTLPDAIEEAFRTRLTTVTAGSRKNAEVRLKQQVDSIISEAIASFRQKREAAQARIDTPEEYDSLGWKCGEGAVKALFRQ